MMIEMMEALRRRMMGRLKRRSKRIDGVLKQMEKALRGGQSDAVYNQLSETARQVELLCLDLRGAMARFHSDLRLADILPPTAPYPQSGEVKIALEDGCVCIRMAAMLPFPSNGSVYFLHERLRQALEEFIRERGLPRPFFTERCAVVFLHHYGPGREDIRHLRDYDNVEHRCVTNVLAADLLWGDSPKCMIAMDVLAPGDINFTEIRITPLPAFRAFVMSEKIEFKPE